MQASVLLLRWGSYRRARNMQVLIIYFSSLLCCPLCFQGSAQIRQWEGFLVFGNFSLFKTPFPGRNSIPPSFVSFFVFYIFSYLLSKTWVASLGAWCPLPAFRSCFVGFTQRLNVLLMNLWGRKCSPHPTERLLLNHVNTPGFLAPGGEEFNPGPETRLDCSELLCNKVLLKYKGDRKSFWHRHQKGAERVPAC